MSVSIICACKNRIKPLTISISSWLLFDEVKEIIVTDWNSDDSIEHLTGLDPRITIVRVNGEEFFNQPQPLNLASKFATQKNILKLDCDHILNPYYNFFDIHKSIDSNNFVAGVFRNLSDNGIDSTEFIYPLFGLLYVDRERFNHVGGFNEEMGKYYSVEDNELSIRLRSLGMKLNPIDLNSFCIFHIPHSDYVRVENFEGFKKDNHFVSEFNVGSRSLDIEDLTKEKLKFRFISREHTLKNIESFMAFDFFQRTMKSENEKITPDEYSPYTKPNTNWNIKKLKENFYLAEKIPNK